MGKDSSLKFVRRMGKNAPSSTDPENARYVRVFGERTDKELRRIARQLGIEKPYLAPPPVYVNLLPPKGHEGPAKRVPMNRAERRRLLAMTRGAK